VLHKVTISKPFYMGIYEVTQGQWKAVMGYNPSYFKDNDRLPVERVSWNECRNFTEKLCLLEGLPIGSYSLPTEAQWEYACRAGTSTALNSNKNLTSPLGICPNLESLGWYKNGKISKTSPTGLKKPNAWGLYDMHGNVWERCLDWFGPYNTKDTTDPSGPQFGTGHVDRGGSWSSLPGSCRSACRASLNPKEEYFNLGFRIIKIAQK
jgi:formylglycine-generating enzyme required for sulfatase activity